MPCRTEFPALDACAACAADAGRPELGRQGAERVSGEVGVAVRFKAIAGKVDRAGDLTVGSLASAAVPLLSSWLLGISAFGWPLVAAGVLKIAYDLMPLRSFSRVKPPEEG